ncbi:hypothetical protein A3K42_00575 [candidate division WWE3 bacterium RBG_13_37_7]|uniref:SCP domain-containing protein n=1 Tax=candidate division WWE3 bacterium RBG_13_37_7 TaxID=1802609 RepID=A0A1F4U232_UNCKA|nr:MAG: hypothetical protein A3K42_00575 [candidate division WWE3 bacterium RBG_13_37_7]
MSKKHGIAKWRKDPKCIEKYQFLYHILPHPLHHKRATLLSTGAFFSYLLLIVLLMGLFRFIPAIFPGVLGYASNINVRDLLTKTNTEREKSNLSLLVLNEKLSKAAEEKAKNMFKEDYWAHVSPKGVEPWDFIVSQDYDYTYAGENLAKNFSSSLDVVKAWMESPSHRENVLNRNYKEIGFAVVNGVLDGYETTLVVQMFGTPRDITQVATKQEEARVLDQISTQAYATKPANNENSVQQPVQGYEVVYTPKVDVSTITRMVSAAFVVFIISLLVVDVWYSRKKGIVKFTGHTLAHIIVLIFAVLSIWFLLIPGRIL